MKKLYYVLGAVAVIGIGVAVYSVGSTTLSGAATAPVEVEGIEDSERLIELAEGVTLGDEDAPVTIVEFGDYQCPGCGSFATNVKPQIQLQLVDQGLAKFVFYDFPLVQVHPHAFLAARAARCAGEQGSYWDYHDLLFQMQPRWSGEANAIGSFRDYAESVGLDEGEFNACLQSDRYADVVTANMELGAQLGVSGTPTVMVNADDQVRRVGGDFRSIQQAVEALMPENGEGG
ncbi:MAG: DsbA family protein [Gemmatimonadota bacterium]|nr:DsbA family protein [Gemmatimonadota bacterium]